MLISPLSVFTDGKREISARDSKNLWELYLSTRGDLSTRVQLLISPINSPVQAAYSVLDNEVTGWETLPGDYVIPGASTKVDKTTGLPDWARFTRFDQYSPKIEGLSLGNAEEWAVAPFVDESGIEFSATNFRDAIDANIGLENWIPEGVSIEDFYAAIQVDTPGAATQQKESKEGEFQSKMRNKLEIAYSRLLDKGGASNTAPYTQKREKRSNAFLAEDGIEEMSTAGGAAGGAATARWCCRSPLGLVYGAIVVGIKSAGEHGLRQADKHGPQLAV